MCVVYFEANGTEVLFLFIPGVMHDGHYLLVRHAQVNDAATPRVRLGPAN